MVTINRDRIKNRIKELGYTYSGVAKRAEMSIYTLQRIISDHSYGTPKEFTRKRLAKVLEGAVEDFFSPGGTGQEKAS